MARPISALTKFILSLPGNMPVADVMAKAKANGTPTSKGNVHQVRSKYELGPGGEVVKKTGKGTLAKPARKSKRGATAPAASPSPKRGPGRPRRAASTTSPASTSSSGLHGLEKAFISAVIDLGLARAQQLLDGLRVTLRAITEG